MREGRPTLSMAAAAEMMEVKISWARELLTNRHKKNPGLGLLSKPSGAPRGRLRVDAAALCAILREGRGIEAIESLADRVGFLEADMSTANSKIERIERRISEKATM